MQKIKWGVLGCAGIAIKHVIPAMKQGKNLEISAIASRSLEKSKKVADELSIPKAYGSYEELLKDKDIDAIYIPLPNHMHLEWCIKAMEHGKHVLCEKPIVLESKDIEELIKVRDKTGMKISEAFMVRNHPQWIKVRELVKNGEIGDVISYQAFYSYFNNDPGNIRNVKEYGGGSLWDIGCYPINTSRFIFDDIPTKTISDMEIDPDFKTDILTSVIIKYPTGVATFTTSTQMTSHQRVIVVGSKGKIEIEIPYNAPTETEAIVRINDRIVEFDICNQYTLQGENFSSAILNCSNIPSPLEDSLINTKVIEAIFKSNETGKWEEINI